MRTEKARRKPMKIEKETGQDVTILRISGRLDATTAQGLEKTVLDIVSSNSIPLLLNMAQLDYISSAGLRVLILALKKSKEQKNGLSLCCLQENVNNVLEIAGFLPLFTIYATQELALTGLAD